MNKVILKGRLTADPELRSTASGISACKFTIAVDRKYKNQNGEKETDFISCQAWRNTADFISRYFSKGSIILVEGNLRTGKYQDKNHSDITHYTTDVVVENAEFCESKSSGAETATTAAPPETAPTQTEDVLNYSEIDDFEEILSDGEVPF